MTLEFESPESNKPSLDDGGLRAAILRLIEEGDEVSDQKLFDLIPLAVDVPPSIFARARVRLAQLKQRKLSDEDIYKELTNLINKHRPPRRVSMRMDQAKGVEWLVDGWLPRGMAGMMTGKGGVGKSRWTLQLAHALTTGHGWVELGLPSPQTLYRVMVAGYEDTPDQQAGRLWNIARTVQEDPSPDISEYLYILDNYDLRRAGPIWGQDFNLQSLGVPMEGWDAVMRHAAREKIDLLIIDPLASSYACNENDRNAVGRFMNALAAWCEDAYCTVLLVAHPPKDSTNNDYSGSTAWEGGSRFAFKLDNPEKPDINGQTSVGKEQLREWRASLTPQRKDLVMFKSNHSLIQARIPYESVRGVWTMPHVSQDWGGT